MSACGQRFIAPLKPESINLPFPPPSAPPHAVVPLLLGRPFSLPLFFQSASLKNFQSPLPLLPDCAWALPILLFRLLSIPGRRHNRYLIQVALRPLPLPPHWGDPLPNWASRARKLLSSI